MGMSEIEVIFRASASNAGVLPGSGGEELARAIVDPLCKTPRRDMFTAYVWDGEEYSRTQIKTTGSLLTVMQSQTSTDDEEPDPGVTYKRHQWISRKRVRSLMRKLVREGDYPIQVG